MMILIAIVIIVSMVLAGILAFHSVGVYAEEQWERKKESWANIISSELPESERKEALKTLRKINNRDRELYHSKLKER